MQVQGVRGVDHVIRDYTKVTIIAKSSFLLVGHHLRNHALLHQHRS